MKYCFASAQDIHKEMREVGSHVDALEEHPAESGLWKCQSSFLEESESGLGVAVFALIPSCGGEGDKDNWRSLSCCHSLAVR